jgi:hypothetical protein
VPVPTVAEVTAYLGPDSSWSEDAVTSAYNAELAAQRKWCRIPNDHFPDDLGEALKRRVAHNLALRGLPLGVQATISDYSATTTRVGGEDAEVIRLERPYRRRSVG